MAQKNRTQLNDAADSITAQITALFADNSSGAITEEALRTVSAAQVALAKDLADSAANLLQESPTFLPPVVGWLNSPPGSPVTNSPYLTGQTPSGAWAGHGSAIAIWSGSAWSYTACTAGQLVPVQGTEYMVRIESSRQVRVHFERRHQRRVNDTIEVTHTSVEDITGLFHTIEAGRSYILEADIVFSCSTVMTGLVLTIGGANAEITGVMRIAGAVPEDDYFDAFAEEITGPNVIAHSTRYTAHIRAVITEVSSDTLLTLQAARSNTSGTIYLHKGSAMRITDTTTAG